MPLEDLLNVAEDDLLFPAQSFRFTSVARVDERDVTFNDQTKVLHVVLFRLNQLVHNEPESVETALTIWRPYTSKMRRNLLELND